MNDRKMNQADADVNANPELDRVWSRMSDELPPMSADSAILTKAREEVSATGRRRGFLPASWMVPVGGAFAAGLVLAVSFGTFRQQANEPGNVVALSPAPAYEIASVTPSSDQAEPRRQIVAEMSSIQKEEDELEQILVKPLERSVPRAPAAQGAVAPSAAAPQALTSTAVVEKDLMRRSKKTAARDETVFAASSQDATTVATLHDGANTASTLTIAASQTPGNSKEAISDTLSEMLDEISNSQGELDDHELDLLFTSEESWLTSIQRLLTNQNKQRALQLADKFRQRFPDAAVPDKLKSLFDQL